MQDRRNFEPRSSRVRRILQAIKWVGRGESLRQLRLLCIFADVQYLAQLNTRLLASIDFKKDIVNNPNVHADGFHEGYEHNCFSFIELQFPALEYPEGQTSHQIRTNHHDGVVVGLVSSDVVADSVRSRIRTRELTRQERYGIRAIWDGCTSGFSQRRW